MTLSLDIANLERLYAEGEATPEEIVREVYARIRARGVRPDWITLVEEDAAVAKARTAPRGPLYGIPFAVKDNIDVAGLPTTCACPEFAYVAERSATVVERLEQAGAILIGKTNLDQFATGLNGTRSPYGIPASAFNPDYISGGSSSGSAVAVAAGLVSFALGTDTAGSGRVPAAFNNIVGLKPSKGLISMRGVVPACRTQDAVSIFALTVADAAKVAMTAIAFDGEDAFARSGAPPFTVEAAPAPLRVGVPIGPIPFFGDKDYEALYHASIDRLAALGAVIVPIDFTPFARGRFDALRRPLGRRTPPRRRRSRRRETLRRSTRWCAASSSAPRRRARPRPSKPSTILPSCIREARGEWAKVDCLLLPTAGTTYTIAEMLADPVALNTNLGAYTNFVNLMDLAALAVPAGFRPDGIPFGVTLIGPALSDGMLACVGDALHRSLDRRPARSHVHSFVIDTACDRTREAGDVGQSGRGRGASYRPAPQLAACRAQGEAPRNHAHRPWLSALRPCRYLARQTGPGVRWHRPGRHRGRSLGDGGGGLRVVRGLDSGALGHRHRDPRRRAYGQRLSLRGLRDDWG